MAQHTGMLIPSLIGTVIANMSRLDMRELSPDAPRYTSADDRCECRSIVRPEYRCILQTGHVEKGFVSCQFSLEDK